MPKCSATRSGPTRAACAASRPSMGGRFARTLVPIARQIQLLWEYLNYVLALAGLAIVYVMRRRSRRRSAERYV